jgi:hypothetical protein
MIVVAYDASESDENDEHRRWRQDDIPLAKICMTVLAMACTKYAPGPGNPEEPERKRFEVYVSTSNIPHIEVNERAAQVEGRARRWCLALRNGELLTLGCQPQNITHDGRKLLHESSQLEIASNEN